MLALVTTVKLITEVALLSLLGQWIVGLLAGQKRDGNPFYKVLEIVGKPFVGLARLISPRFVLDRHVPLVAFILLVFVWIAVTVLKIQTCLRVGVELCK